MSNAALGAVLCILVEAGPLAAQSSPAATFDADMTPATGGALVDFAGTLIGRAEDALLAPRLFEEDSIWRRSAGVTYRFAKLFLLDVPAEDWLRVANHEVFGHGARLRERFDGPIDYRLDAPPPYGGGGGSTSFSFDREPTVEELLAVTVGGMEANNVGATRVALRAVRDGAAPYRDMLRYLLLRLDAVGYMLDTGDEPEEEGHDVSDFVILLREVAGSELMPRDLRGRAFIALADPMLGYAVYGLAVSYLWRGDTHASVPTFRFGPVRYLPALRVQLAPFGIEWVVENTFVRERQATRVSLRIGEAPGSRSFGASLHRDAIWTWRHVSFDLDVHGWRQPRLLDDGTMDRSNGAAGYAAATLPINARGMRWAAVVVQGGYKTRGFIEGEPLGSGFVLRAGVGLAR